MKPRIFCLSCPLSSRCLFSFPLFPALSLTDGAAPRSNITTPRQQFGHDIGDDYQLVNYTQETEYLQKLTKELDRMKLVDIGLTGEGRHQYMAIISSPENIKNLDHYREINQKLAMAKGLTDDQAKALAEEGRAIVWTTAASTPQRPSAHSSSSRPSTSSTPRPIPKPAFPP